MNALLLTVAMLLQSPLQVPPVTMPAAQPRQQPATKIAEPPPPAQVMAIPDALKSAFQKEVIDATTFPEKRLQKLVEFVFDEHALGMTYHASATQTVSGAFATRQVNCLTSTLLIVALAREAGLSAEGQLVDEILAWGAVGDTVVQSRHANAIIHVSKDRRFVVDVDASDTQATQALNPISDEQLLALFYGNRAVEFMVQGHYQAAEAWFAEAQRHSPADPELWNNIGVLRLREGNPAAAETYFKQAVAAEDGLKSAIFNLVGLYRSQGNQAQTKLWQARADKALRRDPYYQFNLARRQEQAGSYAAAVQKYHDAIRLNRTEHRFHFALARTYFQLGEYGKAARELSEASELSVGDTRERYQGKLLALQRMRH